MRKILRDASMLQIHRHMTGSASIRGVLAFDPESIEEWNRMQAAAARPRARLIKQIYQSGDE